MMKKRKYFWKNNTAVLGLPMRLTVCLLIGTVALIAILSYIMNPGIFPHKMIVSVTPMLVSLPGNSTENLTFWVNISEIDGHPLHDASVIIDGLGGAGSGYSDTNGTAVVHLTVYLEEVWREGYLDLSVSAPGHESLVLHDMIKIVSTAS
jgi:hypothetical protein